MVFLKTKKSMTPPESRQGFEQEQSGLTCVLTNKEREMLENMLDINRVIV